MNKNTFLYFEKMVMFLFLLKVSTNRAYLAMGSLVKGEYMVPT